MKRNHFYLSVILLALSTFSFQLSTLKAQSTVTYTWTNPGSGYSIAVPSVATNVQAQLWGGGGGGGSAYYGGLGGNSSRAGGGGGGAYTVKNFGNSDNTIMSISVGAGGNGGTSTVSIGLGDMYDGDPGIASTVFYKSENVVASGGNGGQYANYGWTGHSVRQSGAGGNGGSTSGGESGSGPGVNGGNGDNGGYGGGGYNGGGNTGNMSDGNNGYNGNSIGGGGAGGRTSKPFFGGKQSGGAGARGEARITFTLPQPNISLSANPACLGNNMLFTINNYESSATYTLHNAANNAVLATFSGNQYSMNVNATGTYYIKAVYNINATGATSTPTEAQRTIQSSNVTVNTMTTPSFNLGDTLVICTNSILNTALSVPTINDNGCAITTWEWFLNGTSIHSGTTNPLTVPSYTVTTTDNNAALILAVSNVCGTTTDTIILNLIAPPSFTLGKLPTLCKGTNLDIAISAPSIIDNGTPITTWEWLANGNLMLNGITANPTIPSYTVTTTDTALALAVTNACGTTKDSLVLTVSSSCRPLCAVVSDIEGNQYTAVEVNGLCWFTSNLKSTLYSNGNAIPNVMLYADKNLSDSAVNAQFGMLYDWISVTNNGDSSGQGACPDGWRLPDPDEWRALSTLDLATLKLPAPNHWLGQAATNTTGISLVPGGMYNATNNRYEYLFKDAFYWAFNASTPTDARTVWCHNGCFNTSMSVMTQPKEDGYSVRCVKK